MHQKQQNWCILSVIYNGQIGITLEMELHWLNAKNPVLDRCDKNYFFILCHCNLNVIEILKHKVGMCFDDNCQSTTKSAVLLAR